ncbi:nitrate- and nitrite sensing domain-containing protein [Streptomyces sp. NBC_01210]|uniref:sensor histidine kinase n=1 Tax=Streptomyces sp. NBC_01210 TaxID=2903774 RepID=UPI002E11CEBA|nr:nitrate- and nitrite sensing domain-containing protein [Streptomyces sp. NBC_01210]
MLQLPALEMFRNLQRERALTAVWLTDTPSSHEALDSQRPKTDAALATMGGLAEALKDAPLRSRVSFRPLADAIQRFPLQVLRKGIDTQSISGEQALSAFTQLINLEIKVTSEISAQVDDGSLVAAAAPLGLVVNAAEQIAREDTVLAPAMATGLLTHRARAEFIMATGTQRFLLAALSAQLSDRSRPAFQKITSSAAWKTMVSIENAVLGQPEVADGSGSVASAANAPPPSASRWDGALRQVSNDLDQFIQQSSGNLRALQTERASQIIRKSIAISAAGLAVVAVVAVLSWRIAQSLLRRMAGLREATLELAEGRLPTLVDRLNRNETIDVSEEAPELDYGHDELGQVVKAFNTVQRTAVRSAVALADVRHGLENVILGIARRTQNLVNRQLTLLDRLESEHQEPKVLQGLYELDSQASQIRRYQENLVITAGSQPGRRFTEPVSVVDVLRSAVGEVADYQRIAIYADETLRFAAHAVADLIHLLTELIDNAASFSPPEFPVAVNVEQASKGLVIQIEDRGFGMSEDGYAESNRRLAEPPPFDVFALAEDARVGLFVVAWLAARHHIEITLRASPFGGTSAIVLIPAKLVINAPSLKGATADVDRPGGTSLKAVVTAFPRPSALGSGPTATSDSGTPRSIPLPPLSPQQEPAERPTAAPFPGSPQPPPCLPQRVPQASGVKEPRRPCAPVSGPDPRPGPLPTPERLATTMAAFQRGSVHARDFGGPRSRPTSLPRRAPDDAPS